VLTSPGDNSPEHCDGLLNSFIYRLFHQKQTAKINAVKGALCEGTREDLYIFDFRIGIIPGSQELL
jgi:hypothetical protein